MLDKMIGSKEFLYLFNVVDFDEKGTYLFSSKDMCLINQMPKIFSMGVESLKIEGRLKTEYYLATVVRAYRNAIDDYIKNSTNPKPISEFTIDRENYEQHRQGFAVLGNYKYDYEGNTESTSAYLSIYSLDGNILVNRRALRQTNSYEPEGIKRQREELTRQIKVMRDAQKVIRRDPDLMSVMNIDISDNEISEHGNRKKSEAETKASEVKRAKVNNMFGTAKKN